MANVLYPLARQSFLSQNPALDWDTDDIRVALVRTPADAGYTYNAANQYLSSVAAYIVARSSALATKTVALGVAGAANITFTAPAAGRSCNLVIYKYNAADASAQLIAFIDTGTGLPVTTNGGDVTVAWDTGANLIFAL